jgi:hypothetical protein
MVEVDWQKRVWLGLKGLASGRLGWNSENFRKHSTPKKKNRKRLIRVA